MNTSQPTVSIQDPDNTPRNLPLKACFAVWAVASAILFASLWPTMKQTLHWDEVDYVLATRQGLLANATDSSAFSAPDFLRFVMAKLKNRPIPELTGYNETNDVFILRHTHPPLLQYMLALLGPGQLNPGHELAVRLIQFSGAALLVATMLWGYLKISSNPSIPGLAGTAAAGVLCGFFLGRDLNCHLWISVSLTLTCITVGQFMAHPSRNRGMLAGAAIGLNFLGLQTGVFVAFWAVIAVGVAILLPPAETAEKTRKFNLWPMFVAWLTRSVWMLIGFLAVLLVTYPAAIFRLSLVRIFAVYAFLILKGSEYSNVSSRYSGYLQLVFPLLLLGFIGLAGLLFQKRSTRWYLAAATAIIGFGYGLVLLKFLLNITYITPALALLATLGIATISSWNKPGLDTAVALGLIAFSALTISSYPAASTYATAQNFNQLAQAIGPRQALIEGGHILQFYAPQLTDQVLPITVAADQKSLIQRDLRKLLYNPITPEQLAGRVVILRTFNGLPVYEWEKQLPPGVRQLQIPGLGGALYEFPAIAPKNEPSSPGSSTSPAKP